MLHPLLSLIPNTKCPQRDTRGESWVFSTADHKSWDQRASGNSKGSAQRVCLGTRTALAEWFPQRLTGSARANSIRFLPNVSVSLWLLPENKETFISILKPLFPCQNLYFLIISIPLMGSSIPLLYSPFQGEQHSKQQNSHCQTTNPTKNPPA